MKSGIRGSVIAAVAIAFVLNCSIASQVRAQETAAAEPELTAKGVWKATTTYAKDDIVTARGSSWISLRAGNKNKVPGQTSPSTAAYWRLFARGFNPLGAWSGAKTYQPDDLVTSSGQTYRAKLTNLNRAVTNTTYWELLASKGAAGPNTGIGTGSSSAPAISFTGDADTGIYHPADGKIALVENGELFLHNIGNTGTTALGLGALASNTTGESNTAVGHAALAGNTSGHANTAVGLLALGSSTTGTENTAVGYRVLRDSTIGDYNTGLGAFVLASNTTGSNNTAVGRGALPANNGNSNTAVGLGALTANTTGDNNTAVGENALQSNTTGSGNLGIGKNAGQFADNAIFSIFIANAGDTLDTTTIKVGTQGVQTTAFMAGIRGITTTAADAIPVLISSTGQLGTVSSSRRYKTDIETMADMSAMLAKLRPVTFHYKQAQDGGAHPLQYGLIAEEVADVFPDLAVFNKDGSAETVKYHLLPSFLLAGWQAQQKTIATQAGEIAAQAGEIAELKQRLANIEAMLPKVSRAAALQ